MLKRIENASLHHYVDGVRKAGANPAMRGDCTRLRGDCTGLWGPCTDLRGNCSGLSGDLDACGLTPEARAHGVDIETLVQ